MRIGVGNYLPNAREFFHECIVGQEFNFGQGFRDHAFRIGGKDPGLDGGKFLFGFALGFVFNAGEQI